VTEGGKAVKAAKEGGDLVVEIGAGSYAFQVK
jgi:hypothetical protein